MLFGRLRQQMGLGLWWALCLRRMQEGLATRMGELCKNTWAPRDHSYPQFPFVPIFPFLRCFYTFFDCTPICELCVDGWRKLKLRSVSRLLRPCIGMVSGGWQEWALPAWALISTIFPVLWRSKLSRRCCPEMSAIHVDFKATKYLFGNCFCGAESLVGNGLDEFWHSSDSSAGKDWPAESGHSRLFFSV